jgi:hypothetical protein
VVDVAQAIVDRKPPSLALGTARDQGDAPGASARQPKALAGALTLAGNTAT